MVFNILSNVLLGIVGGIISSIIVSKVFLLLGEYQEQKKSVEILLRKADYISGFFHAAKAIFEVSYDGDIEMKKEMKRRGYKTPEEYYAANSDKDWISKSALLSKLLEEVHKISDEAKKSFFDSDITIPHLKEIQTKLLSFMSDTYNLSEFSFAKIRKFEYQLDSIRKDYSSVKKLSAKQLLKMIIQDRTMRLLFVCLIILFIATIISYFVGI